MDKKAVIDFFDLRAASWDEKAVLDSRIVNEILDFAGIGEGCKVLDVATGTGILIPYYLSRKVSECVGVDISPKMTEEAKNKFKDIPNVKILCADAEESQLGEEFDCIVIHNAFPHFVNPRRLFENLGRHLKKGGRITVAHSMSRAALVKHHSGVPESVSSVLPEARELKALMDEFFLTDIAVSDNEKYVVSGLK